MRAFYSILYAPVRQASGEQLAIGLILTDGTKSYFHYSTEKLSIIKKLLPISAFNLLKSYLVGINIKLNEQENSVRGKMINSEYMDYLSNYNSNLLTFSKPSPIDLEINEENFKKLFEKFIFAYNEEKSLVSISESIHALTRLAAKRMYSKIENRVNFDRKLTSRDVSTLIVPVNVSFIGKNENPVAGELIDFGSKEHSLSNTLAKFISLIKAFEMKSESGKYFVLGKEPDKINFPQQHETWSHIYNSGFLDFVDADESESVVEYMNTHNVTPFIK